jgi:hypothetical protein
MKIQVEMTEEEREILLAGLEILSPDSYDAQDALEVLTQRLLGMSEEPGEVDLEFDRMELELSIAALEIVNPDDYDMQDLASALEDRLRVEEQALGEEGPEL